MKYTVSHARIETLHEVLPDVEGYLKEALKGSDEYKWVDIINGLLSGESLLFLVDDGSAFVGATVVTHEIHPRRRYLAVHLLGGDRMKEWVDLLRKELRGLAAGLGYDGLSLMGRKGWIKIFPDLKNERVILIDPIGEEDGR
jgi:hypothetical protein